MRDWGEGEAMAGGLLESWGENWSIDFGGAEGEVMICNYSACFPD